MNHFVNVTFVVPDSVFENWMQAYRAHASDAFGAKVMHVEELGTDQTPPDRCPDTPDFPFMNEEWKA